MSPREVVIYYRHCTPGEEVSAARPGMSTDQELVMDWTRVHSEGSPPPRYPGGGLPGSCTRGASGSGGRAAWPIGSGGSRCSKAPGVSLTPPPPPNKAIRDVLVIPETPTTPADAGIIRGRTLARTPPERRTQSEDLVRSGAAAAPRLQQEPCSVHPMGGIEGENPGERPFSGPLGTPVGVPTLKSVEVLGREGGDGGALYQGSMPPSPPPPVDVDSEV